MKTIFRLYIYLSWAIVSIRSSGFNRDFIVNFQLNKGILEQHLLWLNNTIEKQSLIQERKMLVKSIVEVDRSLWVWSYRGEGKVVEYLHNLLKKESPGEVLRYLIIIAGKLRLKEVVNTLIMIFYKNTQDQLLCITITETLKRIKPKCILKLLVYAVQHCSLSICKEVCELPYYTDCEEKILDQLVSLLAYHYSGIPLHSRIRIVRAIEYIKARDFIWVDRKKAQFSKKAIDNLCWILREEKETAVLEALIDALMFTSSPKIYEILIGYMTDKKNVSLKIRKSIIRWFSSVKLKKRSKKIFLQEINHEEAEIRIAAINGLSTYLTPQVTATLLDQLVKHINVDNEREALIEVLSLSPLLKGESSILLCPPHLIKKYKYLREKMISIFLFSLDRIERASKVSPEAKYEKIDVVKLVRYLCYLRFDDGNDMLWKVLQYQKLQNSYLGRELLHSYLRLYKQAPILLLDTQYQKKVVELYLHRVPFLIDKLFPSELVTIIFNFVAIYIPNRYSYESLPLLYTGSKKKLSEDYDTSHYLERLKGLKRNYLRRKGASFSILPKEKLQS